MRWLADECVDASLVRRLREAGHDIVYVLDEFPGYSDTDVILCACNENRLLLTEDRDFGEFVFRRLSKVPGIVHLRIAPEQRFLKWPQVQIVIATLREQLFGRYTVIEPQRFRSRPLP